MAKYITIEVQKLINISNMLKKLLILISSLIIIYGVIIFSINTFVNTPFNKAANFLHDQREFGDFFE